MQMFESRIDHHVPLVLGSIMLWLQNHTAGMIGGLSIFYAIYRQYHDRKLHIEENRLKSEENRLKREELDLMRQEAEYRRRADRP